MSGSTKLYIGITIITLVVFGGLFVLGSRERQSIRTPATTGAAYSVAFDEQAKVLYFYSDACHFCQLQKPILDDLAQEGYRVKPMDVLKNRLLLNQHNVEGTPTFVAENGDRLVGLQEKEKLKNFLDAHGGKTVQP